MKRLDEPIQVRLENTSPLPTLFRWNGDTYDIKRVLEVWRKESKWWRPGGNERRDYYRCVVKSGASSRGGHTVVIIYRRTNGTEDPKWILARKID